MSAGELLVVLLLLAPPALSIAAVVDAANRPAYAFQQAGFEKVLWITLAAMGIVFTWIGVVGAVWYLGSVRPKVAAAQVAPALHRPAPPPPALAAPTVRPPEWLADPTRRHQLRFWDGAAWSHHVSDAGQQSIDPV